MPRKPDAWVVMRASSPVRYLAIVCLALLAACAPASAPSPTPTPELTEAQIAQKAVDALTALDSFHFELSTDTGGRSAGSGFSLVSASGDAAQPDKLSAALQVNVSGFTAAVNYISVGGKHFMTDPISHQWLEVPPQFNTIAVFSPEQGAPAIVRGLQNLKKQGIEKADGVDSYHLSGTAGGDVLQPILGVSAPGQLKADVWIGMSDFLARKIVLGGAILQGEPDTTIRTLALSKFNEQVVITAPTPGAKAT